LFIYPGYQWRVVEGLKFSSPRSSLLMLVSALIGRQRLLALYQEAIASDYRYSFGDAMLILPEARKIKSARLRSLLQPITIAEPRSRRLLGSGLISNLPS